MNITILGAGNAGSTVAADLTHKGHKVTLLKTSDKLHNEHYKYILANKKIKVLDDYIGNYEVELNKVSDLDDSKAITDAELIIVYVQTNFHENIIKKISPYLRDGQVIMFQPGYLSTCYLLKYCDKKVISIEAESSPIDCRITESGVCRVLFKNVLNPFGVYPSNKKDEARKVLDLLEYPYRLTENVIEAALHNPNLIVHTVGAIFSIPRIEYTSGDYWMYKEVFTPSVWNVCEALDEEKMNVLSKLNITKRQKYVEACQERNFIDDKREPLDAFFDYAKNSSPKGPEVSDSRYITEDVPQGLVMLESLGEFLNIPTPTCSSLINIANVALNRDLRTDGRTLERLGFENIKEIQRDHLIGNREELK